MLEQISDNNNFYSGCTEQLFSYPIRHINAHVVAQNTDNYVYRGVQKCGDFFLLKPEYNDSEKHNTTHYYYLKKKKYFRSCTISRSPFK